MNSVLNARFILQDGNNFVTFGSKSDVATNITAIATATAATVLLKIMKEKKIITTAITMKNKNVVSFNIDKINYIINDASVEENWGKKLDEINNKKWDGKDIINKTLKIFNEKCKDYKSNFNHQTQDILNLEGIKNRVPPH